MTTIWWEYFWSTLALALLVGYHWRLYLRVRRAPLTTAIGLNIHSRRAWVEMIMSEPNRDLLAVQTLRNWSMSASLLASTAILINIGVFNVALTSYNSAVTAQAIHHMALQSGPLWAVKLVALIADYFFVFFSFALAIRAYNRVGFMINIPSTRDPIITPDLMTRLIGRGMTHYSLGMRGYYLSVPLSLWLFGAVWLLVGTLVMMWVMYRIDYRPD